MGVENAEDADEAVASCFPFSRWSTSCLLVFHERFLVREPLSHQLPSVVNDCPVCCEQGRLNRKKGTKLREQAWQNSKSKCV